MTDDLLDDLDRRLNRSSLIVTIVVLPVFLVLHSFKAAASFGVGAVLSYINFHWLKQAVDFVVLESAQGKKAKRVLMRFVGRYALIALFLYVTIRSSVLGLVFVFAGLLVFVAAILIECLSEVARVLARDYREWKKNN